MSLDTYEKQLIVNKEIFSLSERLGIKCIATNDVHFASRRMVLPTTGLSALPQMPF